MEEPHLIEVIERFHHPQFVGRPSSRDKGVAFLWVGRKMNAACMAREGQY